MAFSTGKKAMNLTEALSIMASGQIHDPETDSGHRNRLETAIRLLTTAPWGETFNKSLFLGLRSPEESISRLTISAIFQRLEGLPDEKDRDRYIGALLDECLYHLFPAMGPGRVGVVLSELLNLIAKYLNDSPQSFEHHKSRFLSIGRRISTIAGSGRIVDIVVDFQRKLAGGNDRSDQMVAERLRQRRKNEIYLSPRSTESTILAYLREDSRLPSEQIGGDIFRAYRKLLSRHDMPHFTTATEKAISNLTSWIPSFVPDNREQRDKMLEDAVRASATVPWEELSDPVRKHLESHLELLPGSHIEDDFIHLLRGGFSTPETFHILVKGLDLLDRMPMTRFRIPELITFFDHPGYYGNRNVGSAFIDLFASLATGLASIPEPEHEESPRERKRRRSISEMLATDRRIRELLFHTAVNGKEKCIEDRKTHTFIRERCWRALLRLLPENREELFLKGVMEFNGMFFLATLDEAASLHFRIPWETVLAGLDRCISGSGDGKVLLTLIRYFRNTAQFEALKNTGQHPGLLMELAMGDSLSGFGKEFVPDREIKHAAEEAIFAAGYGAQIDLEKCRRRMMTLQGKIEKCVEILDGCDQEITFLSRQLFEKRSMRSVVSIRIQELFRERDILVTRGWMQILAIRVDLAEKRAKLAGAISLAREQSGKLDTIREEIRKSALESRNARDVADMLTQERDRYIREMERLQKDLDKTEHRRGETVRKLEIIQNDLLSLRSEYREIPSLMDSSDKAMRKVEQMELALMKRENDMLDLENRIGEFERQIQSNRVGIHELERVVYDLETHIEAADAEIRQLEGKTAEIRSELETTHNDWAALKAEIKQISTEIDTLEKKYREERLNMQKELSGNSESISHERNQLDACQKELQSVVSEIRRIGNRRNENLLKHAEWNKALEESRQAYDKLVERATRESTDADTAGYTAMVRKMRNIREDQEFRLVYSWNLHRALRIKIPDMEN